MVGLGCSAKSTTRKGTAVSKTYQTEDVTAIGIAVPEAVSVSMAEIADDLREGLPALAVGAGHNRRKGTTMADAQRCRYVEFGARSTACAGSGAAEPITRE